MEDLLGLVVVEVVSWCLFFFLSGDLEEEEEEKMFGRTMKENEILSCGNRNPNYAKGGGNKLFFFLCLVGKE